MRDTGDVIWKLCSWVFLALGVPPSEVLASIQRCTAMMRHWSIGNLILELPLE